MSDIPEIFLRCHCDPSKIRVKTDRMTGGFEIQSPERVVIGDGCVFNAPLFIHARGSVTIGRWCHIAGGLAIHTVNHDWRSAESLPYGPADICKPVVIGDAVWICANVTIAPGVMVGRGAILSIGSVVFEDVPECAIVRGNPAHVIKYRDWDACKRLFDEGKFI